MEEPEIAIPPHTQKRIIDNVCKKSAQAIFTSHSPYVLGEFKPSEVLVLSRIDGVLSGVSADYPPAVKPKAYRTEFRSRFCEAILARRVLILEGRTEYDAIPAAARRLNELHPDEFKTLEGLGIAIIDAQTDSQVAPLGEHFKRLGKDVFAIFDQQTATSKAAIVAAVNHPYESPERTFEKLILNSTAESALRRFGQSLVTGNEWPPHLAATKPTATLPLPALKEALGEYFKWSKGEGTSADLLGQCSRDEMPVFIRNTLTEIQSVVDPPSSAAAEEPPESTSPPRPSRPPTPATPAPPAGSEVPPRPVRAPVKPPDGSPVPPRPKPGK
jgi:putative ATP-dependent endonuclease of OLD family